MLCCGYTLTDFPISIRLTSLALWQSNDCPSASKATLMNMDKYFTWIHYEPLHNHNKAKHNKTVCIFLGIYCRLKQGNYCPTGVNCIFRSGYLVTKQNSNVKVLFFLNQIWCHFKLQPDEIWQTKIKNNNFIHQYQNWGFVSIFTSDSYGVVWGILHLILYYICIHIDWCSTHIDDFDTQKTR